MLDPATIVEARDSRRIALIATLQHLPGRQRAVLILRDVLGWPASHVVATSTAAVKSTLQRARARLKEEPPDLSEPVEPGDLAGVLDQYIAAVEEADGAALERLPHVDARVEATPWRTWYSGRATCVPYLVHQVLGSPGDWRLRPDQRERPARRLRAFPRQRVWDSGAGGDQDRHREDQRVCES